jgi:hypothetical protein
MKASLARLAVATLVLAALNAPSAFAQYTSLPQALYPDYQAGCPARFAPDMCGGYFYCTNGCTWFGPSYYVYPPFPPVNGIGPPPPCQFQAGNSPGNVALPFNPWTRSPRDFFMWTEAQQEIMTRKNRPPFVP